VPLCCEKHVILPHTSSYGYNGQGFVSYLLTLRNSLFLDLYKINFNLVLWLKLT